MSIRIDHFFSQDNFIISKFKQKEAIPVVLSYFFEILKNWKFSFFSQKIKKSFPKPRPMP